MRLRLPHSSFVVGLSLAVVAAVGCSDDPATVNPQATGGVSPNGGSPGGTSSGGASLGGTASGGTTGGVVGAGGTTGGVVATGGASVGGAPTGGSSGGVSGGTVGGVAGGGAGGGGRPGGGLGGGGATAGGGVGGGTAGGTTTGGTTSGTPATFETLKLIIESNNWACLGAACHSEPGVRVDLRTDPGLYMRLTTLRSKCMNLLFVSPGKPEESALTKILRGPCGEIPQMPGECERTQTCVDDEYIDAVEAWIANGAPPE